MELIEQHLSSVAASIMTGVFFTQRPIKPVGKNRQTYLDLQGWHAVEQSVVSEVLCKRCQEAAACLAACA